MAGRGIPAAAAVAAAAAGRPRGRPNPNKVTKPPSRGGIRQSSIPVEHLEAHLAAVKPDHHGSHQSSDAGDDDHDHDVDAHADHADIHQHHDPALDAAADADADADARQQFDFATSAAIDAAHRLMGNGAAGHPQPGDSDIHPDLHDLTPHPGPDQQQQHQGQAPQQQQQNFVMDAPMHADEGLRTATDVSKESGYEDLVIDSALSKRLSDAQGIRLAVQRRQDQVLNLKRRSNVEALLAHVSGQEAHSPCKSCHKGYGPWNGCIVVSGLMCGSCANCWFNASGSRCSFHETNLPQTQQHVPAVVQNPAIPSPASFIPPSIASSALGAIPAAALAPQASFGAAPNAFSAAGPNNGAASGAGGPGSLDQWARGILDRTMADMRTGDPHLRFQARIEASARSLALAIAEYNDFLAVQDQGPGPGHGALEGDSQAGPAGQRGADGQGEEEP